MQKFIVWVGVAVLFFPHLVCGGAVTLSRAGFESSVGGSSPALPLCALVSYGTSAHGSPLESAWERVTAQAALADTTAHAALVSYSIGHDTAFARDALGLRGLPTVVCYPGTTEISGHGPGGGLGGGGGGDIDGGVGFSARGVEFRSGRVTADEVAEFISQKSAPGFPHLSGTAAAELLSRISDRNDSRSVVIGADGGEIRTVVIAVVCGRRGGHSAGDDGTDELGRQGCLATGRVAASDAAEMVSETHPSVRIGLVSVSAESVSGVTASNSPVFAIGNEWSNATADDIGEAAVAYAARVVNERKALKEKRAALGKPEDSDSRGDDGDSDSDAIVPTLRVVDVDGDGKLKGSSGAKRRLNPIGRADLEAIRADDGGPHAVVVYIREPCHSCRAHNDTLESLPAVFDGGNAPKQPRVTFSLVNCSLPEMEGACEEDGVLGFPSILMWRRLLFASPTLGIDAPHDGNDGIEPADGGPCLASARADPELWEKLLDTRAPARRYEGPVDAQRVAEWVRKGSGDTPIGTPGSRKATVTVTMGQIAGPHHLPSSCARDLAGLLLGLVHVRTTGRGRHITDVRLDRADGYTRRLFSGAMAKKVRNGSPLEIRRACAVRDGDEDEPAMANVPLCVYTLAKHISDVSQLAIHDCGEEEVFHSKKPVLVAVTGTSQIPVSDAASSALRTVGEIGGKKGWAVCTLDVGKYERFASAIGGGPSFDGTSNHSPSPSRPTTSGVAVDADGSTFEVDTSEDDETDDAPKGPTPAKTGTHPRGGLGAVAFLVGDAYQHIVKFHGDPTDPDALMAFAERVVEDPLRDAEVLRVQ